jgi:hypothetical protein
VVKLQAQTPILDGTAISVNRINNWYYLGIQHG